MKINKFKSMSVAVCCLLTALWAEINGAEEQRDEPAGIINSFAGEMAPDGWLLCNGQEYNSREYPRLYEVVKTRYVPANEELRILRHNAENNFKLFCVPDLRGRVIVGVDGGAGRVTANNTLGKSGGEEEHILTIPELARHNHKIIDCHAMSGALPWSTAIGGAGAKPHVYAFSEESGGDQPHNNMQPYTCLNYIINTGNSNNQKYYNNSNVIQLITSFSQNTKSTSSIIPNDTTIPQNMEGKKLITTTITPKYSTSTLMIDFSCPIVGNECYMTNVFALFQDNIVNALNVGFCVSESISRGQPFFMRHIMLSGTTNPTTFKIRFGTNSGTVHVLRSQDGGLTYGGIPQYSLTITEFLS